MFRIFSRILYCMHGWFGGLVVLNRLFFINFLSFEMEVSDKLLLNNRDWAPWYLATLVNSDFYDFDSLWSTNVDDLEIVKAMESYERYSPIVEDISLEDHELCAAVEKIELE